MYFLKFALLIACFGLVLGAPKDGDLEVPAAGGPPKSAPPLGAAAPDELDTANTFWPIYASVGLGGWGGWGGWGGYGGYGGYYRPYGGWGGYYGGGYRPYGYGWGW